MAGDSMNRERILIVEDEHDLRTMVSDYLSSKGYIPLTAADGATALRVTFEAHPDLIILDLNLPSLDGLDVARTIRSQTDIPIIVASARGAEDERISGFESGVDDYVVKPYSLPELVLRIQAVLRRRVASEQGPDATGQEPVSAGDLVIDPATRKVTVAGKDVDLTGAQFSILMRLARAPGRVFTRQQLLESFQEHAWEGYERTIDVHIKNIRKAIEADPRAPVRLKTVWGVGYRLDPVV